MTTDQATTPTVSRAPSASARGNFYGTLWRGVPRELGFLVIAMPIALAGFITTITLFSAGVGTLITFFIGVVLFIAALYVSRGFGSLELVRLEWAGRRAIERPEWQHERARTGFFGWLRSVLGNGHYWVYLVHTMLVNFAISLFSWVLTITWVSTALGGVTYWFWSYFLPDGRNNEWFLSEWVLWMLRIPQEGADFFVLDPILYFVFGAIMLATLPFVTRGLVLLHDVIARGMLSSWRSDALEREVMSLTESRGAAISAEGHSLRRLERDIHDGPQQRLVRMQMDLAAAERQLDGDPQKARTLIAEAVQQSREALEELRALSRGFAPPILLDRGLVAALESAGVRSPIPTRVVSELPEGTQLPQEIERNAYFVASEALANAAKHSGATEVEVGVATRRLPQSDETWLDVSVTDNGRGGAVAVSGRGIAGLDERLRGLGGTLEVSSPAGGPTVVTAHLPLTNAMPASTSPGGTPPE